MADSGAPVVFFISPAETLEAFIIKTKRISNSNLGLTQQMFPRLSIQIVPLKHNGSLSNCFVLLKNQN